MNEKILKIILQLQYEKRDVDFMDDWNEGYNSGLEKAIKLLEEELK